MITILGPTATGKTRIAALCANTFNGEIISADSRQVFKNMNLGTGKDYADYIVNDKAIPYHLIDIVDAGKDYNVHQFLIDFYKAYNLIISKSKTPILCGGTGLYLDAAIRNYYLPLVPENKILRKSLNNKTLNELVSILKKIKTNHNTTDFTDKERAIRAIEISEYIKLNPKKNNTNINSVVIGLSGDRAIIKERITNRLKERLEQGLIEEVEQLLAQGVTYEKLNYYGLEYRYISLFLQKQLTYEEMFEKLNIAIHQFSKRQSTWFRRMEKQGILINWIDISLNEGEKLNIIKNLYYQK